MGNCRFCGEKVGFLKSVHRECESKYNDGVNKLKQLIPQYFKKEQSPKNLISESNEIANSTFIQENDTKKYLLEGLEILVEAIFEDGLVTEVEEEKYMDFVEALSLSDEELSNLEIHSRIVKGSILRELIEGKVPDRVSISGDFPFILQKDEKVVYYFNNVNYSEIKTRRTYVGSSLGTSFRIAKGVYLRSSAFKGRPVETQELVNIGTGTLCIGSKNMYFHSQAKAIKIPYTKILTLEAYTDGLGLQKDNQSAKPQVFVTGDGWFTYNLVQNLIEQNKK